MPGDRHRLRHRLARALLFAYEHVWLAIFVIAVVGTFVFGFWGFFVRSEEGWLSTINGTISLFFWNFNEEKSNDQLEAARLFAALVFILVGRQAVLLLFRSRIDAIRTHLSRSHVVICGLGRRGARLVQAFRDKGYRVVAIERDAQSSAIAAARERGALVVAGDATDPLVLERAGIARAKWLIGVGPDDETNIEVATQVINIAETDPRMADRSALRMVVHVENEELTRALGERGSGIQEYPLEFVNAFKSGAWSLLDHPTPLGADGEDRPHLLVLGLGRMGTALVVASALLWRKLADGSAMPLRLTVVDREAAERMTHLRLRYPELAECELKTVELEPDTAEFEEAAFLLKGAAGATVTRVYVCLEDHVQGLSAGLSLLRKLEGRRVPVVVQVPSEKESAGRFLEPGTLLDVGLHVFGLIEHTCTAELLLETPDETLARLQHRDYLRNRLAAGKKAGETPFLRPWEELTEGEKEESRESARSVRSKLDAIGAERRELVDWDLPLFEFSDEEVERLAQFEHERWVSSRLEKGWRFEPQRDDERRVHPDLVPWPDLQEGSKAIDRSQIRNLPQQLARAGYEIHRFPPEVTAQRSAGSGGTAD